MFEDFIGIWNPFLISNTVFIRLNKILLKVLPTSEVKMNWRLCYSLKTINDIEKILEVLLSLKKPCGTSKQLFHI